MMARVADDGVAREARRDRLEIRDFAGQAVAGHSVPPRYVRWVRKVLHSMRTNGPACPHPIYVIIRILLTIDTQLSIEYHHPEIA